MLEDFFLLVRRIPGLSLSVNDFWELDTWTTQKLLDMEYAIIEEERKALDDKPKYTEEHEGDSEEMKEIMEMMSE